MRIVEWGSRLGQRDKVFGAWWRAWGDSARRFRILHRINLDCGNTPNEWLVVIGSKGVPIFSYRKRRGRKEVISIPELQVISGLRPMGIINRLR